LYLVINIVAIWQKADVRMSGQRLFTT